MGRDPPDTQPRLWSLGYRGQRTFPRNYACRSSLLRRGEMHHWAALHVKHELYGGFPDERKTAASRIPHLGIRGPTGSASVQQRCTESPIRIHPSATCQYGQCVHVYTCENCTVLIRVHVMSIPTVPASVHCRCGIDLNGRMRCFPQSTHLADLGASSRNQNSSSLSSVISLKHTHTPLHH